MTIHTLEGGKEDLGYHTNLSPLKTLYGSHPVQGTYPGTSGPSSGGPLNSLSYEGSLTSLHDPDERFGENCFQVNCRGCMHAHVYVCMCVHTPVTLGRHQSW
jgi:hypothetical protein